MIRVEPFLLGFLEKQALLAGLLGGGSLGKAKSFGEHVGTHLTAKRISQGLGKEDEEAKVEDPRLLSVRQRLRKIDPEMYQRLEQAGLLKDIELALA